MGSPSAGGDFIKETTATTGTGDYALGGAVAGSQPFSFWYGDGDRMPYVVVDAAGNFEIGVGTYNAGPNTITRGYIWNWNGATHPVNWGAGSKSIYTSISGMSSPLVNVAHNQRNTDPTTTDDLDSGYDIMSLWINTRSGALSACSDPTVGAAVWNRFKPTYNFQITQVVTTATRLLDASSAPGKIVVPDGGMARITATVVAKGTSGVATWVLTSFWNRLVGGAPTQVGSTSGLAPDFFTTPLSTTFGVVFVADADNASVGIESTVDNTNGVNWSADISVTYYD